jgi:hypothetical protein
MMMRTIALSFALMVGALSAFAQSVSSPPVVSPCDTSKYLGQTVAVRGIVSADTTSRRGNRFLNMCGAYPNQAFTGFIPVQSAPAFSGVPSLGGKTVTITGPVQPYQGKAEIVMNSPSQLKVE